MIKPVPREHGEFGFWSHPDFYPTNESNEWNAAELVYWLKKNKLIIKTVWLRDDNPWIFERFNSGIYDVHDWNPTPPAGAGWFLVSIHDSEDSPVCVWVRHLSQ
ncbi:hypothetical protein [Xenorhabdus kozodoii]|uniref:Uncharacterized protein n=1 Tax=Xenorhabdus kozodoii TaxID=351676 RepID=A0A2D0KZX2_9GAMM|nr:hypothetical protein [Xenorhabdus kozodoii]PHM68855.1 hypothetical protein Xkoz_03623 [Xenorhabdus kozodoii]